MCQDEYSWPLSLQETLLTPPVPATLAETRVKPRTTSEKASTTSGFVLPGRGYPCHPLSAVRPRTSKTAVRTDFFQNLRVVGKGACP